MDEKLRRCIDTHLAPWMAEIERYRNLISNNKEVVPGALKSMVSQHLSRATEVCDSLQRGDTGIGSDFLVKDSSVLHALMARESMYRLAISSLADRYIHQHGNPTLGQMMAWLSRQPLDVQWGIRVKEWGHISDRDTHINKALECLDELYGGEGSEFQKLLRQAPSDGRHDLLLTRALEAVALAGLVATWGNTLVQVRSAIWNQPSFPKLRNRSGPRNRGLVVIPSDNNRMKFGLHASPVLCQVYEHDEKHWFADHGGGFSSVDVHVGYITSKSVNSATHYHGRTPIHIYLTVLIQRLGHSLGQAQMEGLMGTTEIHVDESAGLPDDLARHLITGQYKPCGALIDLADGKTAPPSGRSSTWFARTGVDTHVGVAAVQWPKDVHYLRSSHVCAMRSDDGACGPTDLGTLRIPWAILGEQVDWLDTTLIARLDGRWSVIPAMILEHPWPDGENEPSADEDHELMHIVLSPDLAGDWPVARLRSALSRATWAYHCRGSAAFLAGALDLDSAQ